MGRRSQLCCCSLVLVSALLAPGLGVLFISLLYFFVELVHDGVHWQAALNDVNFVLDNTFKMHPWFGMPSKDILRVAESDDHVTAICKAAMFLKPTEVPYRWPVVNTADPVRTRERLEAFVEACRAVFAELPAESPQRVLLEGYRPPPGVPAEIQNVTSPVLHGAEDVVAFTRSRSEAAATRPSLSERWAVREPSDVDAGAVPRARSVRPEVVHGAEGVVDAIWRGKVAVFDAAGIIPKSLLNITMSDIARRHGELARSIPIYRQMSLAALSSGWESLASFADRLEKMKVAGKLYYPTAAPKPRDPTYRPSPPPASAPWWLRGTYEVARLALKSRDILPERAAHELRRELYTTTVNTRRLPELHVDMEGALGHPPWLERAQPLLWSGAVGAWWHNDEPDNLLIGLSGEMDVAVFEAQDTDYINGMRGPVNPKRPFDLAGFHPDEPESDWVRNNPWIEKVPYIRVRLKPGMGIVVPSRAYHAIWAEDADRLMLNCFMVPKYRAMDGAPAASASFFGLGRQPDLYMALFHLKMSSVARLWETRRLGGFFEMTKLESL